ncbi:MAG: hypothetical protein FWG03_03090 [Clostridiales bacterium]|nr:hypothetical protein [Clostridiales bacterium]
MSKRVLTIALVIVFAFALTLSFGGCGDKNKAEDDVDTMDISIGDKDEGGGPADNDQNDADDEEDTDTDAGTGTDMDEDDEYEFEILETYAPGEWPDNEFTKQFPEPDFGTLSRSHLSNFGFEAYFDDVTLDDVKNYVEQLKEAGFTSNLKVQDTAEDNYSFKAESSAGYLAEVFWMDTEVMPLHITVGKK